MNFEASTSTAPHVPQFAPALPWAPLPRPPTVWLAANQTGASPVIFGARSTDVISDANSLSGAVAGSDHIDYNWLGVLSNHNAMATIVLFLLAMRLTGTIFGWPAHQANSLFKTAAKSLASIDPNSRGGGGDELDTYIKDGALNRDLAWVPYEKGVDDAKKKGPDLGKALLGED